MKSHNSRTFVVHVILITLALFLGAFAQAQPTNLESDLATIFATELDGAIVACPQDYPITHLAACFRVWGSNDLTSMQLNNAFNGYNDVKWLIPWEANGSVLMRAFEVTGHPIVQVFLTRDPSDTSRTMVWFIEFERFPE